MGTLVANKLKFNREVRIIISNVHSFKFQLSSTKRFHSMVDASIPIIYGKLPHFHF